MQPADEGDDDRGEAVAGRHVRRQLAERPGDLERRRRGPAMPPEISSAVHSALRDEKPA